MSDQLATIDLTDASQKIRETVQAAFVDLITPEQWQAMIERELKVFTTGRTVRDNYGNNPREEPSKLSAICQEVLADLLKTQLKEHLANLDAPLVDGQSLKDLFVDWLEQHRSTMLKRLFNGALMGVLEIAAAQAMQQIFNKTPDPYRPGYNRDGSMIPR